MPGELSPFLSAHFSDLLHVALVSDKNFADARVGKSLDLVHPLPHVVEGLSIRHVIHDDDPVRTFTL